MLKLFALFFFISFSVTAEEANIFKHPSPIENLANIEKTIPQPEFLRGDFEQIKTIKGSPKKFISNGSFIFSKKDGLYWNTKKPFSSIIIFTKNSLLKIEDGNKEIVSADSSPFFLEFSQIFQSIFSGETKEIQHNFNIFFTKQVNTWVLGLRPNSNVIKNIITEIVIKGEKNAQEILLKEQHGDSTLIKFKNVNSQQKPLSKDEEKYFRF